MPIWLAGFIDRFHLVLPLLIVTAIAADLLIPGCELQSFYDDQIGEVVLRSESQPGSEQVTGSLAMLQNSVQDQLMDSELIYDVPGINLDKPAFGCRHIMLISRRSELMEPGLAIPDLIESLGRYRVRPVQSNTPGASYLCEQSILVIRSPDETILASTFREEAMITYMQLASSGMPTVPGHGRTSRQFSMNHLNDAVPGRTFAGINHNGKTYLFNCIVHNRMMYLSADHSCHAINLVQPDDDHPGIDQVRPGTLAPSDRDTFTMFIVHVTNDGDRICVRTIDDCLVAERVACNDLNYLVDSDQVYVTSILPYGYDTLVLWDQFHACRLRTRELIHRLAEVFPDDAASTISEAIYTKSQDCRTGITMHGQVITEGIDLACFFDDDEGQKDFDSYLVKLSPSPRVIPQPGEDVRAVASLMPAGRKYYIARIPAKTSDFFYDGHLAAVVYMDVPTNQRYELVRNRQVVKTFSLPLNQYDTGHVLWVVVVFTILSAVFMVAITRAQIWVYRHNPAMRIGLAVFAGCIVAALIGLYSACYAMGAVRSITSFTPNMIDLVGMGLWSIFGLSSVPAAVWLSGVVSRQYH